MLFRAAGMIKFAETINNHLASRWHDFASQPYFDERGVFVSAVMSLPLMIIMFIVLVGLQLCMSFYCIARVMTIDLGLSAPDKLHPDHLPAVKRFPPGGDEGQGAQIQCARS